MLSLNELGQKHGADKASEYHGYTKVYPLYLEPLRHEPLTFIELGVFKGASCRMWEEYFTHPNAKLYGFDHLIERVTTYLPDGPRWKGFQGDHWSREDLSRVAEEISPIDVVIDDCLHGAECQQNTWEVFWPHIKPGGILIIEDINYSSYRPSRYPNWYENRIKKGPRSIMPFLNEKLDILIPSENQEEDIRFMHFYKHCVVVGKSRPLSPGYQGNE